MAPQFKKLTDCPENLREAIDWLIQVRHGGDGSGLDKLAKALKRLLEEAIEKARKSITKKEETINNLKKSFKDPDRQSPLQQEIDDAQKVIQKLEEFTRGNNLHDLLIKLCSGIENFLGYDKNSKGYDGSGIVYSDLDRLCDAVVAFLHGVLESVQNDSNVKHYDDTIIRKSGHNTVKGAATHLSENRYAGMSEFGNSVRQVNLGVEGYLAKLGDLTNAVIGDKGALKGLERQIVRNIGKIEELSKTPLDDVVTTIASTIYAGLDGGIKKVCKAVTRCDEPLRNKLNNDFERILMQLQHVRNNAKDDRWRMQMLKESVDEILDGLNISVFEKINSTMEEMESELTNDVQDIRTQIQKINELLTEYVTELTQWIEEANRILEKGLKKIEEILGGIKDGHDKNKIPNTKTEITKKATEMQTKADQLHEGYDKLKLDVVEQVQNAVAEIEKLENLYKDKLNQMKKDIDSAVIAATAGVQGLYKDVENGLENLKNTKMDTPIQVVIQKLKEGIGGAGQAAMARSVIQDFHLRLGGQDDVPKLHAWSSNAMTGGDLYNAIMELQQNDIALKSFKAVLTHLATYPADGGGAYGKTFFEALENDLKTKVKAAIGGVKHATGQFHVVFQKFHGEITGTGTGETVHSKIQKVKDQFKDDFTYVRGKPEIIEDKFDLLKERRESLKTAITDCGRKSFQGAEKIISSNGIVKQTFSDLLRDIIGELQRIAEVVDKKASDDRNGLKQILEEFKNNNLLGAQTKTLKKMKEQFATLQSSNVVTVDSAVFTLLTTTLPDSVNQCRITIQDHIREQVKKAKVAIKKNAFYRYVTSKKLELKALHKFVEERRMVMTNIIQNDLKTGIKGLLATISGADAADTSTGDVRPNFLTDLQNGISTTQARLQHSETIVALSEKLQKYLEHIYRYVHFDMEQNFDSGSTVSADYAAKISTIKQHFDDLLTHITNRKHFDHVVPGKLEKLKKSVQEFTSLKFGNAAYSVLDAFPQSLVPFAEQLERVYINKYEGGELIEKWFTDTDTALTEEGRQAAKVCLTILKTLHTELNIIKNHCGTKLGYDGWKDKKICEVQNRAENPLGSFLKRCGYKVPSNDEGSKQDGELKCKENMKGENILEMLGKIRVSTTATPNVIQLLDNMNSHLNEYNKVCHLRNVQSPKVPCSIYEMLVWLTGLCYNGVYDKLKSHIKTCCVKPANKEKIQYAAIDPRELKLEKTWTITAQHLFDIIEKLCTDSHSIIAAILGAGDAQTVYACDYSNNSLRLHYPQSGEDCLQMLIDILRRVFPIMRFLESQCIYSASEFGWSQCVYGKAVDSSSWQCDDQSNTKLNCQPTSPLMSYLNDSLPGHLPHQLEVVGCKSECKTCSTSKPGMPCLTPLGFRTFSGSTKTGEELCRVIRNFFANTHLSSLFCLMPRPPSTLPEHFGYAFSLVKGWGSTNSHALRTAIESSIRDRSINLYQQPSDLTSALSDAYGSSQSGHDHKNADNPKAVDLSSLSMITTCAGTKLNFHCAPYLFSLCQDYYDHLPNKHSKLYLSWAVYLPWQFWEYLNYLHGSFQNISCQDWGCRACLDGRSCKPGHHGAVDAPCHCKSIVTCKGASPTLYRSGFTFGDASILNAAKTTKNCVDFRLMLKRVINSTYFAALFKECDNLLWKIREPFSYLVLSLWLLSLLYLLHIMVIRLDLLHIKSHLHSPSSHRIAAQSLLAAARVKSLNKVLYLQP